MTENDKKLMNGCYMAEIRTNALDAKPSTAKGFIRGYEKAFSLHVVMQQSELLIAFMKDYKNNVPIGTQKSSKQIVEEYLSNL
tara:strand:+ start:60 stop:308 length:249 start_codon:yes stop_codon:yes gene_type:complete